MDILETIRQIKIKLQKNGLDVDKASKAQYWLYRSGDKIPKYVDDELIMSLSRSKRDQNMDVGPNIQRVSSSFSNLFSPNFTNSLPACSVFFPISPKTTII